MDTERRDVRPVSASCVQVWVHAPPPKGQLSSSASRSRVRQILVVQPDGRIVLVDSAPHVAGINPARL